MDYDSLEKKFEQYTSSIIDTCHNEHKIAMEFKKIHSQKVAEIAFNISQYIFQFPEHKDYARICGLFHDVSRFVQLREYGTFIDSKSFDHGDMSAKIVGESKWLESLPEADLKAILHAIKYHNKLEIPQVEDELTMHLSQIIRDADKIESMISIAEYYSDNDAEKSSAIEMSLPDNEDVSPEVLESLRNFKMVDYSTIKTLNDFKLLKISWVFDINYPISYAFLLDSKCLEKMFSTIKNPSEELSQLVAMAIGYAEANASL